MREETNEYVKKKILEVGKCYGEKKIGNMIESVGGRQYEYGHLEKSLLRRRHLSSNLDD